MRPPTTPRHYQLLFAFIIIRTAAPKFHCQTYVGASIFRRGCFRDTQNPTQQKSCKSILPQLTIFKTSIFLTMTIYDQVLFNLNPNVQVEDAELPAGRVWIAFQRYVLSEPGCEKLYWIHDAETNTIGLVLGKPLTLAARSSKLTRV